jgi:hypothetical protein
LRSAAGSPSPRLTLGSSSTIRRSCSCARPVSAPSPRRRCRRVGESAVVVSSLWWVLVSLGGSW